MWNKKIPYIFLFLGFLAFTFCGGRFNIPASVWIWPAAMILFFHTTEDGRRKYILTMLALGVGYSIKSIGVFGGPVILDVIAGFIFGIIYMIPFLADKFIGSRFSSFSGTFAFPLALTSMEYLIGFSPVGAWNAAGYALSDDLILMQLASVTGIYGVSFIAVWTGIVIGYIAEHWNETRKVVPVIIICPLILILIFSWGTTRLNNSYTSSDTVRAAGVCGPHLEHEGIDYINVSYDKNVSYLEDKVKEAAGKAQILVFCEDAFSIEDRYEEDITEKACSLASRYNLYIVLGLEIADTDNSEDALSLNMIKFITNSGKVEWEYVKTRLVPFVESFSYVKGNGEIRYADTDFGRVTSLICFDCDSPQYVTRINELNADLLAVPSWEWKGIYESHTASIKTRAIENGIPLLKISYDGIHSAIDCYGHVLKESNNFSDGHDKMMIVDIPLTTIDTVFAKAGKYIDLIFLLALLVMAIAAFTRKEEKK